MKKILTLPLKKQWFEMTKTGIKKEEYREGIVTGKQIGRAHV